jgi:UDP-N-acetylmuramoyl-tripeptide--D-alanyl-D-alanine ligase
MTEEEISRAVEKIENKFAGIQFKKGINGLKVIDATYSANPDGVIAHLEYLKTLRQAQGKLVVVMPCLIELGKATIGVHKRIGQKIGEVCNLAIITTKERFKEIKEGVIEEARLHQGFGGREIEKNILFLENPKEIFEKIQKFTSPGDVILLESRVPKQLISLLLQ